MAAESSIGLLRIRVIKRHDAGDAEVTSNLPHLHQSTWTVVAMQPGNPGSSALGSFTIPLFPPGTEGFAAAKPIYDQLIRYMRVEAYISHDGASLGKLAFAGVITGIRKVYSESSVYELTGVSDLGLANLSRPFPGELLSGDVTSAILKSYLGTNELGASDAFNPFTSGNYNSTSIPAHTSGTWAGTTDDGLNVVSCATGSGAALISKTGAAANDRWHTQFAEVTGRLSPSADASFAGNVGIGISNSNSSTNTSVLGFVTAKKNSGRWSLDANIIYYTGGVISGFFTAPNALSNVDDTAGMVPLTLGLLITIGGVSSGNASASLTVNGKVVVASFPTNFDPGTGTLYPYLMYGTPASGSATCYLTNLVQMTRFTTDGPSTAAAFGNGTITTTTNKLQFGVDPGPSHLETWARLATRENFYLRYTPQPYVVGTRTLGKVDFEADPGTDLTASVIFRRDNGSLVSLEFNNNADPLAADTALAGQSSPDGGGVGYWRDIATISTYGVIQDEALSFTNADFNSLSHAARQLSGRKINLDTLGSKTAVVRRVPEYADVYRELDKITIHDPEMGCNYLACRIMARTLTEGSATETLVLDQFSEDFVR